MLSMMLASTVLMGAAETANYEEYAALEQPPTDAELRAREARRVERFGPMAGNWELTLSGGGVSDHRFRNHTYSFNASLGHFLTDHFLVAFRQGIAFTDAAGAGSEVRASSRVAANWHFDLDRFQPFVGANLGYRYGDGRDTWVAGPEAGLKYFVSQQTFLYGQAEYQFFFRNIRDVDDEIRRGEFVFTVGLGFLW